MGYRKWEGVSDKKVRGGGGRIGKMGKKERGNFLYLEFEQWQPVEPFFCLCLHCVLAPPCSRTFKKNSYENSLKCNARRKAMLLNL